MTTREPTTKTSGDEASPRAGGYGEEFAGSAPENYERFFVPAIGAPAAAHLVDLAALRPGERVADIACGTGVVARLAAERVGSGGAVAGVDINPGMLAVARAKAPDSGPSIDWHEGPAESLPLPDDAFDVVLSGISLQFFEDRLAALREMRRVLAPGGRVAISVPGSIERVFQVMADALARHIEPGLAGFVHQVFALDDPDELGRLLREAGFRDPSTRTDTLELRLPAPEEFLWQYVLSTPLAEVVEGASADRRAAMEREVVDEWQAFVENGGMVMRQEIVTGTGRA